MPRTATGLSLEKLKDLARTAAEDTLKRLRAEITAIERTFPELAPPQHHRAARAAKDAKKKTRRMSAAARKNVSERMRRYWAERRKASAKK